MSIDFSVSPATLKEMARQLRIEYPGALYHVLNRGNYRTGVFEEEGAKRSFEACLEEACERSGWILHAWCIMSNHFHLALETPQGNLSDGMKWLLGVFSIRFNRFRKENGHLFQGRYKSIVLEGPDRLASLCHYIHLNPVRAGIMDVRGLRNYRFCSYRQLWLGKARSVHLDVTGFLAGCGGLADTPSGRRKYEGFLVRLCEDSESQREHAFSGMSKGWAHGSKSFKMGLIEESEEAKAILRSSGQVSGEPKELLWETELAAYLSVLGKTAKDTLRDRKFAVWKVAVCAAMKQRTLCTNRWLSENLSMGVDAALSRQVKRLRDGELKDGQRLLRLLRSNNKN